MTYTCAHCGGKFLSDRSDEEAKKEYEAIWVERIKNKPDKGKAILCEVCFQRMMKWLAKLEGRSG